MINVHNIEPNPPAQPSNKGGKQGRTGTGATVQPVEEAGRALTTQREALFFRSEAILRSGQPAQTSYLAQQIGQLWSSPASADHKKALDAYQKNNIETASDSIRPASVLA